MLKRIAQSLKRHSPALDAISWALWIVALLALVSAAYLAFGNY